MLNEKEYILFCDESVKEGRYYSNFYGGVLAPASSFQAVSARLNACKGPVHVFVPLRGFSFPDREGLPHWEPEGNKAFIDTLKAGLDASVPYDEIDAHINDPEFIDPVTEEFLAMVDRAHRR